MTVKLSTAARNDALATGTETWLDSTNGRIALYTNAQPAAGGDAFGGTKVAEWSVSSIAAPSGGSMTVTPAAATVTALASGTPQSFVAYLSTETAPSSAAGATDNRITGTVTATGGGGDLTIDNTTIVSGQNITLTSFVITQPA